MKIIPDADALPRPAAGPSSGCGGKQYDPLAGVETTVFTDDAGRDATVPADITRIERLPRHRCTPDDARAGAAVGLASSPSTAQRPGFSGGDVDAADVRPVLRQQGQPQHGGTDRRRAAARHRRPWRCQGERPAAAWTASRSRPASRRSSSKSDARRNAAGLPQASAGFFTGRPRPRCWRSIWSRLLATAAENSASRRRTSAQAPVLFGTGATGLACDAEGSGAGGCAVARRSQKRHPFRWRSASETAARP